MFDAKAWFATKSAELDGIDGFSGFDPNDLTKRCDPRVPMKSIELARIEKELKVTLPEDYRRFLLEIGGCAFFGMRWVGPIQTRGPDWSRENVNVLYGSELGKNHVLREEIKVYKNRIPRSLIPIGAGGFGDQFCLGIIGEDSGKVYFWDHENERDEQDYRVVHGSGKPVSRAFLFENITLVANSFADFLNGLEKEDE